MGAARYIGPHVSAAGSPAAAVANVFDASPAGKTNSPPAPEVKNNAVPSGRMLPV